MMATVTPSEVEPSQVSAVTTRNKRSSSVYAEYSVEQLVDMLGVQRALRVMADRPENDVCADCGAIGEATGMS